MMKEPISNVGAIHSECANRRREEWQKKNKGQPLSIGSYVKIAFQDKGSDKSEHMWVRVTELLDVEGLYKGELSNDPVSVKEYKCGDMVNFNISEVQETF